MVEVISESLPKARKEYRCMASEFIRGEDWRNAGFSPQEISAIEKAEQNNWKINKGDQYLCQINKYDGRIYAFRAIPDIHAICALHELYPED